MTNKRMTKERFIDYIKKQKEEQEKYDKAVKERRPAYKHKTGKVIRGRGITFEDLMDM